MYDPMIHKVFIVDYRIVSGEDRRIKTHLTYATSRKNAENNTRDMEADTRINIVKITAVVQDQDFHDRVDEALATHKENNVLLLDQQHDDMLDTYQ